MHFSGPRSSSTVPSSLHNGTIENMRDQNAYNRNHNVRSWSAEQSPLRVVTNYNHVTSSSRNDTNDAVVCASAPLSWSDNLWLNNNNNNSGSMGGIGDNNNEFSVDQHHLPSTRSKADEWLEKTLQTSLSLGNSPAKQMHSYSASPISNDSLKNVIDYCKLKFQSSLTNAQNIDVFGQPVFNPLPEQSSAMTNGSPMNANNRYVSPELSQMKARNEESANGNRIEEDPFDVQWSQLSSAKADSTQQSFTNHNTTNPFYSHSSALTT
ncbi:unnamed protein product [Anisakis simplex]|uniref:Transcription factor n=1 Tax=Anisakis simplex TaxID=6269 RepID=A0A0M3KCE4_ANISI|nr:unnamed protein product [Anisakis simplex]